MGLAGLNIWVTRPKLQAQALAQVLREKGACVRIIPMLESMPEIETAPEQSLILDLDLFQKIIFISQSAAYYGLERIDKWWPQWPDQLQWWAIGQKTASVLEQYGVKAHYASTGENSEALLAEPVWQQLGQVRVLIIKGHGGRTLLKEELLRRGAIVSELPVYRRQPIKYEAGWVQDCLEKCSVDVIIATSAQIVMQLANQVKSESTQAVLIVPSQRVAKLANSIGFENVLISKGAGVAAVIEALSSIYL